MKKYFHGINPTNRRISSTACTLMAAALTALAGCRSEPSKEGATPPADKAPEEKAVLVELAEVRRGMIEDILERSSPLEAEEKVQVLARTQNPAIELFVEEGDEVEKGQVLLRLENDRQQTDYSQAMSQLEKAQIDFDTQERLYQEDLISETEYRNARFEFNQAKLATENARRQLEYTEVTAPIRGTITSRSVKIGDQVNSGTPIFEIIDLESTVAVIHVPEQYLPKLKPNMEARMASSTLGEKVFPGYVKRIAPIVEAQAGTIKVVVGVRELGALRPGMWVDVELVLDSKDNAILIPKRAIVYDNDQTYAFKAYTDTNGVLRAERRLVIPLNADKEHIEPGEGFEAGDRIVVAGQSGLKDHSPIRELEKSKVEPPEPEPSMVQSNTNAMTSASTSAEQKVN